MPAGYHYGAKLRIAPTGLSPANTAASLAAPCLAHVRRKFFDVHAARGSAIAAEALERIAALYAIEKEARGQPPDRRVAIRGAKAGPRLDDLERWLQTVKRLSILTPDRRAKLTPLSGTAEVVPVVNRGGACWPTGATGPRARPAQAQKRFLKRQLSLPVSMISQ